MKKAKWILAAAATLVGIFTANAQQVAGGYLMTRAQLTAVDIANLSQFNTSGFGTARSVAMGGAFTSLGSDMFSISLNPAGLGMYNSSEYSMSPSLSFGKMEQWNDGAGKMEGDNTTRFGLNNVGAAFNLYQSSTGSLTSFTLGFSYNKVADFNYRSDTYIPGNTWSVADVYSQQLGDITAPPKDLEGDGTWRKYRNYPDYWGAILAYKSYLLNYDDPTGTYYPGGFGNNISIDNFLTERSRGSIGEYNLSGGFNFKDKLYFGVTFTMQHIYRKQELSYSELYYGDFGSIPVTDRITQMDYIQNTRYYGFGFGMKFGVIYRPVPSLRVGMAVHTPTWTSLDIEYQAEMATLAPQSTSSKYVGVGTDDNDVMSYKYNTPTRLMFGASYTIGRIGILSFDYERTWYGNMKVRDMSSFAEKAYNNFFSDHFKASNTYRVGLEVRPLETVALRAGYSMMESNMKHSDYGYDSPVPYKYHNISGGVGFLLSNNWALDLAYVFTQTKYTGFEPFYYEYYIDPVTPKNDVIFKTEYPINRAKIKRHNILATLSYRF